MNIFDSVKLYFKVIFNDIGRLKSIFVLIFIQGYGYETFKSFLMHLIACLDSQVYKWESLSAQRAKKLLWDPIYLHERAIAFSRFFLRLFPYGPACLPFRMAPRKYFLSSATDNGSLQKPKRQQCWEIASGPKCCIFITSEHNISLFFSLGKNTQTIYKRYTC